MRAIEILENEHRQIERVLAALTHALQRDLHQRGADVKFFLRAAEFIRDYADGSHHVKEEQILFEALAAKGMPLDSGPLGCMLAEHAQGREYARAIADEARAVERGSDLAKAALFENAWSYARLLTAHIRKEDEIIFKLAQRMLSSTEDAELVAAYARVDPAPYGAMTVAASSVLESLTDARLLHRRL